MTERLLITNKQREVW